MASSTVWIQKSKRLICIILVVAALAIILNVLLVIMQQQQIYNIKLPAFLSHSNESQTIISKIMHHFNNITIAKIIRDNATTQNQDRSLPLSHLPKQEMLSMEELKQNEIKATHNCIFRGKVFVLGLSKTGTSTMKEILMKKLGYKCIRNPMITCGYYGLYYYMQNAYLPLYVATDDISWIFHSKPLHKDFMESLKKSSLFGDAPWNFLYPLYDQLIPGNYSKYILLLRDSTRDVVNSNMKMFVRTLSHKDTKHPNMQFDYTNFSISPRKMGIRISWKEFWTLTARQYELHNRNVIEYFTKRGRLNDLLIINLKEESDKMPFSEQWYKITHFLGCPNVTDQSLPRRNIADDNQIDFFPKDYKIEWENFKFSRNMDKILKLVKSMNGKYNENTWNILSESYGTIFTKKK